MLDDEMTLIRGGKRAPQTKQIAEPVADRSLKEVVARASGGDVDAFRVLFDRYEERVRAYTRVRLGWGEDAGDAVQDVFLAAWSGLPNFRYEHEGSFPGWLFGIARHVVGEHRRRRGRTVLVPLDEAPETTVEFEGQSLSRRLLVCELERLPRSQQETLVLRFIVGLSLRQVATALGKTERAITAMQLRGLETLKHRLRSVR